LPNIKINERDGRYGTLTLEIKSEPSDLVFRIQTDEHYGGPKVEQYEDRANLRIEAAQAWLEQTRNNLSKIELELKKQQLQEIQRIIQKNLEYNCQLDPSFLGALDKNNATVTSYFERQHKKAKDILSVLNTLIEDTLEPDGTNSKALKKQLYNFEREIKSNKRPERITLRPISHLDTHYVEVNISTPVDHERTVSSAKKDEDGIANWLRSTNTLYERNNITQPVSQQTAYRSASIVPHELQVKSIRPKSVSRFNKRLASDITRRNLKNHLIPELVKQQQRKGNTETPIKISLEMLTLLSPISLSADMFIPDPDANSYLAIRNAFDQYHGRTIDINVDGQTISVQFSGIYHNYGVNPGRNTLMEGLGNNVAFNRVIDRTLLALHSPDFFQVNNPEILSIFESNNQFYQNMPSFTPSEQKSLKRNAYITNNLYHLLDIIEEGRMPSKEEILAVRVNLSNSEIPSITRKSLQESLSRFETKAQQTSPLSEVERQRLVILNEKKLNTLLNKAELSEYDGLVEKFKQHESLKSKLTTDYHSAQRRNRLIHKNLSSRRQKYIQQNPQWRENLTKLEETDFYHKRTDFKKQVQHQRALAEYSQAVILGYDKKLARTPKEKNKLNYEIQSYIQVLNDFQDGSDFIKTCKSGKDRTNAAEEKQKAKSLMSQHLGRVPRIDENPEFKKQERKAFEAGYLHGPGNDICGDNMAPSAQQVSGSDIIADCNIDIIKSMAQLQKGLNKLDPPTEESLLHARRAVAMISSPHDTTSQQTSDTQKTHTAEQQYHPSRPPKGQALAFSDADRPTLPFQRTKIGISRNLNVHKFYQVAKNKKESNENSDIDEVQLLSGTPQQSPLVIIAFKKEQDEMPVKAYVEDTGNEQVKFSMQKDTTDQNAEMAIFKMCQIAVAAADEHTIFNIPESLDATKKAMVTRGFEKAILEAHEMGKFKKKRPVVQDAASAMRARSGAVQVK
tara:strand:+ start:18427 stop:21315 length:2889 start_codon:yes stop_codon:yes gene_type:complete